MRAIFGVTWAVALTGNERGANMKTHEFTVILKTKPSLAKADRLYGICQDGTLAIRGGVGEVHFHRRARSLEAALRSALGDVRAAGLTAARVEMEPTAVMPAT
jgi:hypothetical protein